MTDSVPRDPLSTPQNYWQCCEAASYTTRSKTTGDESRSRAGRDDSRVTCACHSHNRALVHALTTLTQDGPRFRTDRTHVDSAEVALQIRFVINNTTNEHHADRCVMRIRAPDGAVLGTEWHVDSLREINSVS